MFDPIEIKMAAKMAAKIVEEQGGGGGGGLPVVEITSADYPDGAGVVVLTDAETAQLSAALATGLPAVIKVTLSGMRWACVCTNASGMGYVGGIIFTNSDGSTVTSEMTPLTFMVVDGVGSMGVS